jgi:hypothetical protein
MSQQPQSIDSLLRRVRDLRTGFTSLLEAEARTGSAEHTPRTADRTVEHINMSSVTQQQASRFVSSAPVSPPPGHVAAAKPAQNLSFGKRSAGSAPPVVPHQSTAAAPEPTHDAVAAGQTTASAQGEHAQRTWRRRTVITAPGVIMSNQGHRCLHSKRLGVRGHCPSCNGRIDPLHVNYLRRTNGATVGREVRKDYSYLDEWAGLSSHWVQ